MKSRFQSTRRRGGVAREIGFAIKQPAEVDVNEIVLRTALQDN